MKLDKVGKDVCTWGAMLFIGCGIGYHSYDNVLGALFFWLVGSFFGGLAWFTELKE